MPDPADEGFAIEGDPEDAPRAPLGDADVEQQLREVGSEFIKSHNRTHAAIHSAAQGGMTEEAIARVSGLSAATVAAFLTHP